MPRLSKIRGIDRGFGAWRKSSLIRLIGAAATIAIATVLCGQALAPNSVQEDVPVFTSDTRLVLVHASVLDRNGKLITNLPQSAFKVLENGIEQQIKIFRRDTAGIDAEENMFTNQRYCQK